MESYDVEAVKKKTIFFIRQLYSRYEQIKSDDYGTNKKTANEILSVQTLLFHIREEANECRACPNFLLFPLQ